MFYGCELTFGGRSCREFGLMVYDFGGTGQEANTSFASPGTPVTEHVPGRRENFLYGIDQGKPLEYTLVLTADEDVVRDVDYFSRWEISEVASWLCGHQTYQYLTIRQDDLHSIRFRCVITDLRLLTFGGVPWAFAAQVTCDSPYAYCYPETQTFTADPGGIAIVYDNRSAAMGYYRPKLLLTMRGRDASIVNISDGGREMTLTGLPTTATSILIDCEDQTIIDRTTGSNLYPYCNFHFLRLVRGNNRLVLTGDFDIAITSEFPVDVGA